MKLEDACEHLINLLLLARNTEEFKTACKYFDIKASE